ncbi:hypothetical protein ACHAW6_014451 [Cyclotella cf. meneghiniana]
MNRRFPKDPPSAVASSSSRRSLIRDQVRRRRAAVGIGNSRDGGSGANEQNSNAADVKTAFLSDGRVKTLPVQTESPSPQDRRHAWISQPITHRSLHTTSSTDNYGFDSNVECTLNLHDSGMSNHGTTADDTFNQSPTENKLWNPSFQSQSSFDDTKRPSSADTPLWMTPQRNNRSIECHDKHTETRQANEQRKEHDTEWPNDDEATGFECTYFQPSRNEGDASWSQMHSPGNRAAHQEKTTKEMTSSKETDTGNAKASHRSSNRWDSANVSKAKAIIQQRNQRKARNTASPGGADTPLTGTGAISNKKQVRNYNRTEASAASSPSTTVVDEKTQFIATRMKYMMDWTDAKTGLNDTAKSSPQMAPPRVVTPTNQQNQERSATPTSQAERKECAPSFDEATAGGQSHEHEKRENPPSMQPMEQQQPILQYRLEQQLQLHPPIVSVAVTSSSMFSEDDSVFSNFSHLRAARQQRNAHLQKEDAQTTVQGRDSKYKSGAVSPVLVSPTNIKWQPSGVSDHALCKNKNDMSLSTVHDASEESIRDLHVSLDSRDITDRAHYSPPKERTVHSQMQGNGPHAVKSPTYSIPQPLDCIHGNNISAVHDTSEESIRDVHVSVDSRDIGKVLSRHHHVDRDNKSVKSYSAPSFDEAASVRSRTNNVNNHADTAAKPLDHPSELNNNHRPQSSVGNKLMEPHHMLWGGPLLERSEHSTKSAASSNHPDDKEASHFYVDLSNEAERILNIRCESDFSFHTNRETDRVFDKEDISLSMMKLVESAVQEATWSKQAVNGSSKRSTITQKLPPIHPDRLSVVAMNKDDRIVTQRRLQYPTRNKNGSVPPLTEFSPTRSDHSADAAAGAKQLRNLIFDPLSHEPDVRCGIPMNHEPATKHGASSFQWALNSFPPLGDNGDEVDHDGGVSVDSWEVDIIGSRNTLPSSVLVSDEEDSGAGSVHNTIHDTSSKNGSLSEKLEMLRNSAGVPGPQTNHGDDKSSLSGRVSVPSIQPSVESDCVRQNADIALLMEDTMMDFMVMEGNREEESIYSDIEVEDNMRLDHSEESGEIPNPLSQPNEPQPYCHPEVSQVQYAPPPPSPPKAILNKAASRHHYFSKRHCPSLLSVDEEEEFSEPSFNASSPLSASPKSSANSSPRTGGKSSSLNNNVLIPTKQKDLGHFLDQFRDHLMTGCAPLKDEDLASSQVFPLEISEFGNTFFTTGVAIQDDSDEADELNDRVTPLPCVVNSHNTGLSPQERALKRREDTTPLRTNTTRSKRVPMDHSLHSSASPRSHTEENTNPALSCSLNHDASIAKHSGSSIASCIQGEVQMPNNSEAIISPTVLPDDDVVRSYHSDVLESYERQGIARDHNTHGKGSISHDNAGKVDHLDVDKDHCEEVKIVQEAEWGKMSEREKHKSKSLHWNSNNGVNDDEDFSHKFLPTRAKVCARVFAARTSLSSISSSQALIHEHFRGSSCGDNRYNPDDDERKLSYIHECSREDETDSSGDEVVNNDDSPEYVYDDFLRDFSTIVEAEAGNSSIGQHEDESLEFRFMEEEDELLFSRPQNKTLVEKDTDRPQTDEFTYSLNEMRSVTTSDERKDLCEKSPLKSNSSSRRKIQVPANQSHPHCVPDTLMEVSKTQLEEKLRGIGGINRDSGSSVATSDLGSIITRESEISRSCSIPKMIFPRTHPPFRATDSARSSPSSMCNTYNAPIIMQVAETSKCSEDASMTNKTPPRLNKSLPESPHLSRQSQSNTNPNADVVRSQQLLRDNMASAASSVAMIDEQLSNLRSRRNEEMRNRRGGDSTSLMAVPKNSSNVIHRQGCGTQEQPLSSDPSPSVHDTTTQLSGDTQPEPVFNGVGALRMKYQQLISTASSGNKRLDSNQTNSTSSPSFRENSTPKKLNHSKNMQSEVAKISTFWNQFEVSSDSSIDKSCRTRKTPNVCSARNMLNLYDDASQQSGDAFEIAPRGTGFGVLNKDQWIKDETSSISEDPTIGLLHDVYESLSHNAFEVSPLYIPGSNDTVVAKLPSSSKLQKKQNASFVIKVNGSPLRKHNSVHKYSSLGGTVPTEYSSNASMVHLEKRQSVGSSVASSPFSNKASATDPKGNMTSSHQSNQTIPSTKTSSYPRANVFSSSWKNSPDKKPPTMGNKSIATEKLHARFRNSKKKDSSWIAKQDSKGKMDNSWIVR